MIKHHPSEKLLAGFAAGSLPASMAIGVSIHCDMCSQCRTHVEQLTAKLAEAEFDLITESLRTDLAPAAQAESGEATAVSSTENIFAPQNQAFEDAFADSLTTNQGESSDVMLMDFGNMMDAITADDEISEQAVQRSSLIKVRDKHYELPRALNNVSMSSWLNLGKLSRSSLNLDEGPLHSHILHIDADGEVPTHTHKGFEITLLLDGSFEDEMGTYVAGDFIELNGEHNHKPRTKEGCLCFTVADDALQFTEGFHKLFNPIGSFLY